METVQWGATYCGELIWGKEREVSAKELKSGVDQVCIVKQSDMKRKRKIKGRKRGCRTLPKDTCRSCHSTIGESIKSTHVEFYYEPTLQ